MSFSEEISAFQKPIQLSNTKGGLMRILSIDGGGVRGIIPAMILAELERITAKPSCELFDMMVGTSTGGIIVTGLSMPSSPGSSTPAFSAGDLVELYERQGSTIFKRSPWHRVTSVDGWADNKYPADGIESILQEKFKEARLKDTLVPIVVTSYEIQRRIAFFFKTSNAKTREGYDFALRDVARATSAAPTYFDPAYIPSIKSKSGYYALVDGGVFANNPAMCAYAEAVDLFQKSPTTFLSLGTGSLERPIEYDEAKSWGKAQWAIPILDIVFDGVADTVNYQLEHLLSKETYLRLNTSLKELGDDALDNASRTNIAALKSLATALIVDKRAQIEAIAERLTQNG